MNFAAALEHAISSSRRKSLTLGLALIAGGVLLAGGLIYAQARMGIVTSLILAGAGTYIVIAGHPSMKVLAGLRGGEPAHGSSNFATLSTSGTWSASVYTDGPVYAIAPGGYVAIGGSFSRLYNGITGGYARAGLADYFSSNFGVGSLNPGPNGTVYVLATAGSGYLARVSQLEVGGRGVHSNFYEGKGLCGCPESAS